MLICQYILSTAMLLSCNGKGKVAESDKNGTPLAGRSDVIVCGPPDDAFGKLSFEQSCGSIVNDNFELGLKLLHSFEYVEAEKHLGKLWL